MHSLCYFRDKELRVDGSGENSLAKRKTIEFVSHHWPSETPIPYIFDNTYSRYLQVIKVTIRVQYLLDMVLKH